MKPTTALSNTAEPSLSAPTIAPQTTTELTLHPIQNMNVLKDISEPSQFLTVPLTDAHASSTKPTPVAPVTSLSIPIQSSTIAADAHANTTKHTAAIMSIAPDRSNCNDLLTLTNTPQTSTESTALGDSTASSMEAFDHNTTPAYTSEGAFPIQSESSLLATPMDVIAAAAIIVSHYLLLALFHDTGDFHHSMLVRWWIRCKSYDLYGLLLTMIASFTQWWRTVASTCSDYLTTLHDHATTSRGIFKQTYRTRCTWDCNEK
jgi:hypothetical protein